MSINIVSESGSRSKLQQSLGRAGIQVHAVGGPTDPVRNSRYCTKYADLGGGSGMQERWLEWLDGGPRGAVCIPWLQFVQGTQPVCSLLPE